jgi:hypothetical protein
MQRLYDKPEHYPHEDFTYKKGFFPFYENGELLDEGWLARNRESYLNGERTALELKVNGQTYGAAHVVWGYDQRLNTDIQEVGELGGPATYRVDHTWSKYCAALFVARHSEFRNCRENGAKHFFDFHRQRSRPRRFCENCSCSRCSEIGLLQEKEGDSNLVKLLKRRKREKLGLPLLPRQSALST